MSRGFTRKDVERWLEQGTIKGYTDHTKTAEKYSQKTGKNIPKPAGSKKGDKIKGWIGKNIWHWARAHRLEMRVEYEFHGERKWRFDWYLENEEKTLKVGVEYEGIVSEKSRHTSLTGYTGDTDKYNEAAKLGIIVIRLTALNYKNLNRHLDQILNEQLWERNLKMNP